MTKPPIRPTAVDVVQHETLFKSYSRLDRYLLRYEQYAGGMGPVVSREVLERGHAVAVLLFDPDRDCVVMIEQFRPGAYAAGMEPWLYEIVAGIIEDGETPEEVARRESVEEAGLEPQGLFRVQSWLATPGISSESIELWCGRVDSRQAGGIHGVEAEGEDIRVIAVPLPEVRENLRTGRYTNAATLVALQWLLLNEDDIRKKL
ncbi:NUDIX domain-containing protein [Novispirillum itersonii]|uniref:ADP-ribose pyrophosphatase n=1 Tax=Novispirillum itersonii TaxID=189 RepID=A0A7W9ZFT7_NOVIT|nr:NUDIX domain-containing protein [Novispirillum itersonii]MBB6210625.1 ADP-ribose pyrophosphatase [Novispirillum itersonii]